MGNDAAVVEGALPVLGYAHRVVADDPDRTDFVRRCVGRFTELSDMYVARLFSIPCARPLSIRRHGQHMQLCARREHGDQLISGPRLCEEGAAVFADIAVHVQRVRVLPGQRVQRAVSRRALAVLHPRPAVPPGGHLYALAVGHRSQ